MNSSFMPQTVFSSSNVKDFLLPVGVPVFSVLLFAVFLSKNGFYLRFKPLGGASMAIFPGNGGKILFPLGNVFQPGVTKAIEDC